MYCTILRLRCSCAIYSVWHTVFVLQSFQLRTIHHHSLQMFQEEAKAATEVEQMVQHKVQSRNQTVLQLLRNRMRCSILWYTVLTCTVRTNSTVIIYRSRSALERLVRQARRLQLKLPIPGPWKIFWPSKWGSTSGRRPWVLWYQFISIICRRCVAMRGVFTVLYWSVLQALVIFKCCGFCRFTNRWRNYNDYQWLVDLNLQDTYTHYSKLLFESSCAIVNIRKMKRKDLARRVLRGNLVRFQRLLLHRREAYSAVLELTTHCMWRVFALHWLYHTVPILQTPHLRVLLMAICGIHQQQWRRKNKRCPQRHGRGPGQCSLRKSKQTLL